MKRNGTFACQVEFVIIFIQFHLLIDWLICRQLKCVAHGTLSTLWLLCSQFFFGLSYAGLQQRCGDNRRIPIVIRFYANIHTYEILCIAFYSLKWLMVIRFTEPFFS